MSGTAPIAVVTDSTAYLPDAPPPTIVPLSVSIDGVTGREGIDISPADVARALSARRLTVTTSRPSPAEFSQVYGRLLADGAPGVVSVHLSARLSGTYESAAIAALEHGARVAVVDSRSTGMGLGFVALAAMHVSGQDLEGVRAAAQAAVARTTTLFYVDTLEFLRRSGRIGATSAMLGTALAVKPILHVIDGEIVVREKVRTAGRALSRLVDLAVEAAGESTVDVAVHHLAAPDRAESIARELADRLGDRMAKCYRTEVGAVVGAHVGPGLLSIVVHRHEA